MSVISIRKEVSAYDLYTYQVKRYDLLAHIRRDMYRQLAIKLADVGVLESSVHRTDGSVVMTLTLEIADGKTIVG